MRAIAIGLAAMLAGLGATGRSLAEPEKAQDLVIYVHNRFLEKNAASKPHPRFGRYEVAEIHAALGESAALVAPQRGPDADPKSAAAEIARMVREALSQGRDPATIKIVGASKGAYISMLASEELAEPQISYVLLGGCVEQRLAAQPVTVTGRVLSIYETTDQVAGACPATFAESAAEYREIALETGLGHGFLFRADPVWISPARAW